MRTRTVHPAPVRRAHRLRARAWLTPVLLVALVGCAARNTQRAGRPSGGRSSHTADTTQWRGQNVGRIEELFSGRFPGVQAYAAPGGIIVRIRGTSTIMGSVNPLYVIDGLTVEVGADGLVALNPGDVARIEVLKEAADLAAYGSRAGNGVVRITTKHNARS